MKKTGLIALLLTAYLVALVVLLPARFVMQFLLIPNGQGQMNIQLGGVTGSIWRGHADTLVVDTLILRDLNWTLRPLALLRGALAVDIEVADHLDNIAVGRGRIEARRNQLRVKNLIVNARLDDVAAFSPTPSPLPLRGDIEVRVAEFTYGQPVCAVLQGGIELRGGAIQVGQNWDALGPLSAELGCASGQISAQLVEPNNIGLSATAEFNLYGAQGEYQITSSPEAPRTIRNLVAMLPEQARQRQRFTIRF